MNKSFRNLGLLIFGLLFAGRVHATTVLVTSQVCGKQETLRQASGLAFNHAGQNFVMTVSSNVLNAPGTCHSAVNEAGKSVSLILKQAQWGGLTLLQMTEAIPEAQSTALPFKFSNADKSIPVSAFSPSKGKWMELSANVITQVSRELGTALGMFEIELRMDQGFVGAPLLSANGEFYGLISEEYLEPQAGAAAELRFWHSSKPKLVSNPLVFASAPIEKFLSQALSSNERIDADLVSPLDAQLSGKDVLLSGPFEFTQDCPPPGTDIAPGETPYPIGGTDPVGIGGQSSRPGCYIRVRLTSSPLPKTAKIFSHLAERALPLLQKADRIDIPYVFIEDLSFGFIDRRLIYSLPEFVAHVNKSEMNPLIVVYTKDSKVPGNEPKLHDVRELALKIQSGLIKAHDRFKESFGPNEFGVLRELYFLSEMALSEDLARIPQAQLGALIDPEKQALVWNSIEHALLGNDKTLRQDLNRLKERLKSL